MKSSMAARGDARRMLTGAGAAHIMAGMRTWAVVTARMSSSRLPGKTMAPICSIPSLSWICTRVIAASAIDGVVVATSDEIEDSPIRELARESEVACYAGPLDDVLARTLGAATFVGAERLVFVNGDSPLTDPLIIDAAVNRHNQTGADYVSSLHGGGGFPDGFSVEVFTRTALEALSRDHGQSAAAREHVTFPFYQPGSGFQVEVIAPSVPPPPGLHLSLDTAEDLALIRDIFAALLPIHSLFTYEQVMALVCDDETLLKRAVKR